MRNALFVVVCFFLFCLRNWNSAKSQEKLMRLHKLPIHTHAKTGVRHMGGVQSRKALLCRFRMLPLHKPTRLSSVGSHFAHTNDLPGASPNLRNLGFVAPSIRLSDTTILREYSCRK